MSHNTIITMTFLFLLGYAPSEALAGDLAVPVPADQAISALQIVAEGTVFDPKPTDPALRKLLGGPSRGPAADVYPLVAPSVVIIRSGPGYGTGFIIDEAGWILTNNHVIAGANIDVGSGSRYVQVHFGNLQDQYMELDRTSYPALIYQSSNQKDLALLKLVKLPEGRKLTPLKLAPESAPPGTDCFAIGHPTRGVFWSLRSGEVVGIGRFPQDMIDNVMPQFAMSASDQRAFEDSLSRAASRKSLLSTCGINPGDSGGPLLNLKGEVIAVTFAIPSGKKGAQVSLDKFSYHVHLDEVRSFIETFPEHSEIFRPNHWPPASMSRLIDVNGDQKVDAWTFLIDEKQPATGTLWDLDEDTPESFLEDFKAGHANREHFDAEVAVISRPSRRSFYDRDNDGSFDLILTDITNDGISDLSIELTPDGWKKIDTQLKMLAPKHFASVELQEQFQQKRLSPPPSQEDTKVKEEAPEAPPSVEGQATPQTGESK